MHEHASFGAWIQRRRKALDLTQAELAERVGCALGTVRKIETDERRPSKQIAARLADELQLASGELAVFLKAARAEVGLDQLAPRISWPHQPSSCRHRRSPRPCCHAGRSPSYSPTSKVAPSCGSGTRRRWERR
jgi:DNA-binding XRE family transcriptional regulator